MSRGFRVWDKEDEAYIHITKNKEDGVVGISPDSKKVLYLEDGEVIILKDVIIEQDTGLKDKNGKKIYEGDILAQTLIDDPFTKKYPTYVVCWDEEFLGWALKDVSGDDGNDTDLHFFIEEWKKCEVIGTIHENPELLKGNKE